MYIYIYIRRSGDAAAPGLRLHRRVLGAAGSQCFTMITIVLIMIMMMTIIIIIIIIII